MNGYGIFFCNELDSNLSLSHGSMELPISIFFFFFTNKYVRAYLNTYLQINTFIFLRVTTFLQIRSNQLPNTFERSRRLM